MTVVDAQAAELELGRPLAVAPGVWRLPLPMTAPPGHINSWLLEDGDGWCVVDCGTRTDETRGFWRDFMASSLYRGGIRRIFLTHAHPDHAGSAAWLARETGAPVLMAEAERVALENFTTDDATRDSEIAGWMQKRGAAPEQVRASQLFYQHFSKGAPAIASDIQRVADGDTLTLNGDVWQVHAGYGHTPCNLLLLRAGDGVMITGDQILPDIVTHVGLWWRQSENPLGPYLESLDRLRDLPVTTGLPAHGDPFGGWRERCARIGEVQQQRLQRIEDVLAEGPASMATLLRKFGGKAVQTPAFPLVAGQIYARLAHLQSTGRIAFRADDAGGVFVLAA